MGVNRSEDLAAVGERIRSKLNRARLEMGDRQQTDPRLLLRRRAQELAQEFRGAEREDRLEIVGFRLGRDRLAFESAWVAEVFRPRDLVPVPGAPPFFAGILNRHGAILSVIELAQILELPDRGTERPAVLVLADREMAFGVLVEAIEAAQEVPRGDLQPPPAPLPEPARRYLRGVLPGPVSLLDGGLLLAAPALRVRQGGGTRDEGRGEF